MRSKATTLLEATGGTLALGNPDDVFDGVSIDTRTLQAGNLFVCIQGERFDAHNFLNEAIQKGIAGIVFSKSQDWKQLNPPKNLFAVQVQDTLVALQEIARHHRNALPARVVGITGTNGKSTTKELVASVSKEKWNTFKGAGNLNNHIGLPLNVLNLEPQHEVAVLEMGMSAKGEIKRLTEIASPDIGVITNISEAHMIHLPTIKDVQQAKGEMYESLSEKGTAIVNADDPLVLELARSLRSNIVTFGIKNPADVQAKDIRATEDPGFDCAFHVFGDSVPIHLPFPGRCNIYNALAACATGHVLGVPVQSMRDGLASSRLLGQRTEIETFKGITIINDAYNANPGSMKEAIQTLKEFSTAGRRILVIGDMLELGEREQEAHRQLGEGISNAGIDGLVTVGELAQITAESAKENGMPSEKIKFFESHDEAASSLTDWVVEGDCLLFKGSRGAQMERALNAFKEGR